jgi:hypothetical protein
VGRILDAGQPRKDRRITVTEEPLREQGRIVRDMSGEPLYVTTSQVQERDVVDWRPNLEVLKRRFPERWGDRRRTELTGPDDGVEYVAVGPMERRLAAKLDRFRQQLPLRMTDPDEWPATTVPSLSVPNDGDDDADCAYVVPWSTLDYDLSE